MARRHSLLRLAGGICRTKRWLLARANIAPENGFGVPSAE